MMSNTDNGNTDYIVNELSMKYQNLFKSSWAPLSSTSLYFIHKNFKKPYPQYIDEKINKYKNIIREIPIGELYNPYFVQDYIDTKDEYTMHLFFMAYHDLLEEDEEFLNTARQQPEMKSKGIGIRNFHNEDLKAYTKYFNSIRDYIIEHIDKFSTNSLIHAITSYREDDEHDIEGNSREFEDCRRIEQVVYLYNYCKEHPNNVEPNDKDLILGYLFVSRFCYQPSSHDDIVKNFLKENNIRYESALFGNYLAFNVIDIEGALKLLIPEFNVPQPVYHYDMEMGDKIDILDNFPTIIPRYYYDSYYEPLTQASLYDIHHCGESAGNEDEGENEKHNTEGLNKFKELMNDASIHE